MSTLDPARAIVMACKKGEFGRVQNMLDADSSLVDSRHDHFLAIEWACEAGHLEIGRLLVERGATADIFSCASLGLLPGVEEWLGRNPSLLDAQRPLFDYRPLHCAAECGQPEVVDLLLQRGADANAPNEWGATPVFFAVIAARHHPATTRHLQCCRLLLERGGRAIANISKNEKPLSWFANNAINFAPDPKSKALAEEILQYVKEREK